MDATITNPDQNASLFDEVAVFFIFGAVGITWTVIDLVKSNFSNVNTR